MHPLLSFRGQPPLTIVFVFLGWVLLFRSLIRQSLTLFAGVVVLGREVVALASLGVVLVIDVVLLRVVLEMVSWSRESVARVVGIGLVTIVVSFSIISRVATARVVKRVVVFRKGSRRSRLVLLQCTDRFSFPRPTYITRRMVRPHFIS